ncbi:hypothetical protein BJV82DRAFT_620913 [Fennellomyces sp. T-0311]|nr:hypothetical protein BJV82DRAFT_620913 [Fennellomyces sp. T-0311]
MPRTPKNSKALADDNDFDDEEDEVDDSLASTPVKRSGRKKIKIEYIQDKNRRHITFSKRKAGIMKKAYELSTLTGTQVLLLIVSETGLVYTFTTPKLQPMVTKPEGKNLIQTCLNAPDPVSNDSTSPARADEEDSIASPRPTTVIAKASVNPPPPSTVPLAQDMAYLSSPYMMGSSRYDGYASGGASTASYGSSAPVYQPQPQSYNMAQGGAYPSVHQPGVGVPHGGYWMPPSSGASAQYPTSAKPDYDHLARIKRE